MSTLPYMMEAGVFVIPLGTGDQFAYTSPEEKRQR